MQLWGRRAPSPLWRDDGVPTSPPPKSLGGAAAAGAADGHRPFAPASPPHKVSIDRMATVSSVRLGGVDEAVARHQRLSHGDTLAAPALRNGSLPPQAYEWATDRPSVARHEQWKWLERWVLMPLLLAALIGAHPMLVVVERWSAEESGEDEADFAPFGGTFRGQRGVLVYLAIALGAHALLILVLNVLSALVTQVPRALTRQQLALGGAAPASLGAWPEQGGSFAAQPRAPAAPPQKRLSALGLVRQGSRAGDAVMAEREAERLLRDLGRQRARAQVGAAMGYRRSISGADALHAPAGSGLAAHSARGSPSLAAGSGAALERASSLPASPARASARGRLGGALGGGSAAARPAGGGVAGGSADESSGARSGRDSGRGSARGSGRGGLGTPPPPPVLSTASGGTAGVGGAASSCAALVAGALSTLGLGLADSASCALELAQRGSGGGRGAFQLSRMLRTVLWCGVWVQVTSFITRERPCLRDESGLALRCRHPWHVHDVPVWHYDIEAVFLWMLTLEYCAELLGARDKLKYVASLASTVDLLTMPGLQVALYFVARPFYEANASTFLIQFGWLRFLRLYGLQPIFRSVFGDSLSAAKLRAIAIGLGILSIMLSFAGAVFNEEAPALHTDEPAAWSAFFPYVYFAVVTMSTVGYGDFVPLSSLSRAFAIGAIALTIGWLPRQFGALAAALAEDRLRFGQLPRPGEPRHVLLCGPLSAQQLRYFLATFVELGGGSEELTKVVLLTPRPALSYEPEALVEALGISRARLCIVQGDVASSRAEAFVDAIVGAKAVFVSSDVSEHTQRGRADLDTVTRVVGVKKFMAFADGGGGGGGGGGVADAAAGPAEGAVLPVLPTVFVQSHYTTNRLLLTGMGVANQVYLSTLKMRAIARSLTTCQGCATLLSNLLYAPKVVGNNDASGAEHAWRTTYHRGLDFQIYRVPLPPAVDGYTFAEVALLLYQWFNIILLGVSGRATRGQIHLTQRARRLAGGHTDGFFLAPSKRALERYMRMLEEVGMPPRAQGGGAADEPDAPAAHADGAAAPQPGAAEPGPMRAALDTLGLGALSRAGLSRGLSGGGGGATTATGGGGDGGGDGGSGGGGGARSASPPLSGLLRRRAPAPAPATSPGGRAAAPPRTAADVRVSDLRPYLERRARLLAEAAARAEAEVSERGSPPPAAGPAGPFGGWGRVAPAAGAAAAGAGGASAQHPPPPHVVICGWPRDLGLFLSHLFESQPGLSAAVLASAPPEAPSAMSLLAQFPRAFYVRGSALVSADLVRAGIFEASGCVLFSTPEAFGTRRAAQRRAEGGGGGGHGGHGGHGGISSPEMEPSDSTQVIATAKVHILRLRRQAERERARRQPTSEQRAPSSARLASPAADGASASGRASASSSASAPPFRLVTEVQEAGAIRLVDHSEWWPSSSELGSHLDAPAYAAGSVFTDSMFYPLLCHLYFVPELLALLEVLLSPSDSHAFLQLVQPPPQLLGATFAHAFETLLAGGSGAAPTGSAAPPGGRAARLGEDGSGLLAIGLYKRHSGRRAYVYVAPRRDDVIERGDRIFVIASKQPAHVTLGGGVAALADELASHARAHEDHARVGAAAARDEAEKAQADVGASELQLVRREVATLRAELGALVAALGGTPSAAPGGGGAGAGSGAAARAAATGGGAAGAADPSAAATAAMATA